MHWRSNKLIAIVVAGVVVLAVVPAVVVASIITNATAVAVIVNVKLKPNTDAVFTATSGPVGGVVATCAGSSSAFSMTTKGGGLGPFTIRNPAFTSCTDTFGGTDTITSNTTTGHWTVTYVNSVGSPNPDQIELRVPKAGLTIVSSAAPSCTITLAPSVSSSFSGSYDNVGNLGFSSQTIPYSATGTCPSGTGPGSITFSTVLTSGGTGAPDYSVSPAIYGVQ